MVDKSASFTYLICILRSNHSAARIDIARTFINTMHECKGLLVRHHYPDNVSDTDCRLIPGGNGSQNDVHCMSLLS